MDQSDVVISFTILLAVSLVGGMIAHRLRQPVILGYLIVGAAVGPYALGVIKDLAIVEAGATIGVALLMLTLGLEVSFSQLRQVGKVGLWGGVAEIAIVFVLGILVSRAVFGWSLSEAAVFGLIISLSSTMVGLKVLMDRGELDTVHGRIMVAILILQDIGVVLMIVVAPLLGSPAGDLPLALGLAVGKAALFVSIVIAAGLWALPWLMGSVGGVRSRELFLLTILVLCLGATAGTQILGLSAVFGAFLIGLVLRETRFAHQALAEVTPLRDIFAALFFVSLGMLLDPRFVANNWPTVAAAVAIIVAIKVVTVFGIVRSFGYSGRISVLAGAGLFQIGEFGFILAQGGAASGIISPATFALIVSSAIITMLLTPGAMNLAAHLTSKNDRVPWTKLPDRRDKAVAETGPSRQVEKVVIAGFGRVGQNLAQGLLDSGVPYSVIEIDPEVIFRLHCGGTSCTFGDATNTRVLSQADLSETTVLVVTFPDPLAVLSTVKTALSINPNLKIVARVHRSREADLLKKMGVRELVSPEFEASLEFLRQVLTAVEWTETDISRALAAVRRGSKASEFTPENEE